VPFGYGGPFGYQTDSDSVLLLLGHRYYDPTLGRFLSRDPIGDGRNWYTYCGNNPVRFADPEGTDFAVIVYGSDNHEPKSMLDATGTHVAIAVQDPDDRRVWWWYSLAPRAETVEGKKEGLLSIRKTTSPGSEGWKDPYDGGSRRATIYYYFTDPETDRKILISLNEEVGLSALPMEGDYDSYYHYLWYNCGTMVSVALQKVDLADPQASPIYPRQVPRGVKLPANKPPRRAVYPPLVPYPMV
jgi:RHS repeat-associated protein